MFILPVLMLAALPIPDIASDRHTLTTRSKAVVRPYELWWSSLKRLAIMRQAKARKWKVPRVDASRS